MEKITVAIGDIHGTLQEFDELLNLISYNPSHMRVVLLGDLMDRGPDPIGCVRRARELNLECIMGNHESKIIRWRKHEAVRVATGKTNPMKRVSDINRKTYESLSEDDLYWMSNLPIKLQLNNNWWGLHAGAEARLPFDKQNPEQVMRVRYVNQQGSARPLGKNLSQPDGTVFWTEMWNGPESIVYGHAVHPDFQVRVDNRSDTVTCLGIDTGVVFGGFLTAAFINDGPKVSWAQVRAKEVYYQRHSDVES